MSDRKQRRDGRRSSLRERDAARSGRERSADGGSRGSARSGVESSRRGFLRAAGVGAVVGLSGLAGCLGDGSAAGASAGGDRAAVDVLAAGSLQHALSEGLEAAADVPVRVEAHGSATVARLVAEGRRDPDVVALSDAALFETPLSPAWYSVFASNAVVLAYDPDARGGRRIAEAATGPDRRWYEPLLGDGVALGRTDPEQDPLGYRALFVLELASRYYDGAPALHERVPRRDQIYPETGLISRFETGAVDAALAYRNMAVERGYDYVDLPDRIDLSDPAHAAEWYRTVSYDLPSGRTVRGDTIGYAATLRTEGDAALAAFDALTTGSYLAESGFLRRESFPRFEGEPPEAVRRALGSGGTETFGTDGTGVPGTDRSGAPGTDGTGVPETDRSGGSGTNERRGPGTDGTGASGPDDRRRAGE